MKKKKPLQPIIDLGTNPTDGLVSIFPEIFDAVNTLLKVSIKGISKKAGVLLWGICLSEKKDEESGENYLEQDDIVRSVQRWFVVAENTARTSASQAKHELSQRDFIVIRKGKRIYLTRKGKTVAKRTLRNLRNRIAQTLAELNEQEKADFLRIILKVADATRKKKRQIKAPRLKDSKNHLNTHKPLVRKK